MALALSLLALVAIVVAASALARHVRLPTPLVLTAVGVLLSFAPIAPAIRFSPDLILLGILPPLLYAAAIRMSLVDLGANKKVIGLLSVGLVIATAGSIGLVTWWLMPIPFSAGIALGAVVAPPDAVAATAVARQIGLPRRIVTILEGESLLNDATAITILKTAIIAIAGSVTVLDVGVEFVRESGGGICVGLVIAWVLVRLRKRVTDPTTDTVISFMAPWLAYLPAELISASGVLSVVVVGVVLAHKSAVVQAAPSRLVERINWTTIQYLLENTVFLVIGLQAHGVVEDVLNSSFGLQRAVLVAVAVFLAALLLRPIWIFGFGALIQLAPGGSQPRTYWRNGAVVSWAGMRGVVTLAAVQLLPADTPLREVLVFVALIVVLGTLVVHGLTLPMVAKALRVQGPDPYEDAMQTALVLQQAVAQGERELDRARVASTSSRVLRLLRTLSRDRTWLAWQRLAVRRPDPPSSTTVFRQLRRQMLAAERAEVLRIRDAGKVDPVILDGVMQTLDLEESMLIIAEERVERYHSAVHLTPHPQGNCEHLRNAPQRMQPRNPDGCRGCQDAGLMWVSLRMCMHCGEVGCCESSTGNHARKHSDESGHPVVRSFETGEDWRWCLVDGLSG